MRSVRQDLLQILERFQLLALAMRLVRRGRCMSAAWMNFTTIPRVRIGFEAGDAAGRCARRDIAGIGRL
ncbi:hypothetical protein [Burkholderia stagnalis]|uniref:hypothetical protein n=1 Tax=Burkholderia stagnalis TaxID=1503054 RepID=UPI00325AB2A9